MTKKQLKIVVVGDGACGKTSLIIAHSGGDFNEHYTPTAFDDYAIEALINGKTKMITVCDTAGEDDYNHLRPLSYPDADIFLVCYSVERPESLKNIKDKWIPEIRRFCPDVPILIVGNKKDIRDRCTRRPNNPKPSPERRPQEVGTATGSSTPVDGVQKVTGPSSSPQTSSQKRRPKASPAGSVESRCGACTPRQHSFDELVTFEDAAECAKELSAHHKVLECSAKTKEGIRCVFDTAIRLATSRHHAHASSRILEALMKLKLVF